MKSRAMELFEERERMRKILQNSGSMGVSGSIGISGTSGLSGTEINPNLYDNSETTVNTNKKVKFNIQPIISEREKVKTNWKFWKK